MTQGAHKLLRLAWLATLLALALAVTGCWHAENWPLDPAELDQRLDKEKTADVAVPRQYQPQGDKPLPPATARAGVLELSVEQAAMMALAGNRDLRVSQYNPVIAGTFEQIERGAYDPQVYAELGYGEESSEEAARSTGRRYDVEATERLAEAGVRQRLATGTEVEVSLSQLRETSNRTPTQEQARLGLSITQSLLRGFGPAVNLVGVRQAELETKASVYELRGVTEALLAAAETAYWELVLAGQEVAIVESSLDLSRRQLGEIEERIQVGVLPKIEAAAARAEVARREQALIEAQSGREDRRLRLLRLVNPSGGLEPKVDPTSRPDLAPKPITDLAERMALAEQARPDLNEARLRWQQNRLETMATRNGLLPRLDLFIALGQSGYAESFGNSFRKLDGPYYDLAAGLSLSQYLNNRAAKARDTAALASAAQAKAAVDNLRQIVRLDVRLAANQVERARRQISATRLTRELQEQTVSAEEERFEVGKSTTLLVAQAQRDLLEARINEVQAVVYYRIALVSLYLAEGSLLERRGVTLAGGRLLPAEHMGRTGLRQE